jgi:hypothetical protein
MKETPDWNRAIHKAKEQDSDFLTEYVESRAIPWQFEFQNVKCRKTCSMDMVLMTLFLLCQRKVITEKAIKMASSPIKSILQLIEKGLHAQARYTYLEYIFTHRAPRFEKTAKKGDNPFTCTSSIMDMASYCPLFIFNQKITERNAQNANVQVVYRQERVNVNWVPWFIQKFYAPEKKSSMPKVTMEKLHSPVVHKIQECHQS